MSKLAIFLAVFFVLLLFQQSSYGFLEGTDIPAFSGFDVEGVSDIISLDLSTQENVSKR